MLDEGEKRAVFWGALIGAATGSLLAMLYQRRARRGPTAGSKPINAKQVIRLGASLLPAVRQLLEWLS